MTSKQVENKTTQVPAPTLGAPSHCGDHTANRKTDDIEQFTEMTLQHLYREAFLYGDDAVSRALGHAEAELSRNPGSLRALMYKGSLLTIIGMSVATLSNRNTYIQTGVTLMDNALGGAAAYPKILWEMAYTRASSLAFLTSYSGWDQAAHAALKDLIQTDDFKRQSLFDQTRCLTLLAGLADKFGYEHEATLRFKQARAIDEELAIRIFDAWVVKTRASPDPHFPLRKITFS